MKKKLIPIVSGLLVGILLGVFFLSDIDSNVSSVFKTSINATAFQIGVYTDSEKVMAVSKNYSSGVVVKEDEIYRVYIALLTDPELVISMKQYFDTQGIDVYLKQITITNSSFITNLENYEKVLKETENKELYDSVNNQILKEYVGVL